MFIGSSNDEQRQATAVSVGGQADGVDVHWAGATEADRLGEVICSLALWGRAAS